MREPTHFGLHSLIRSQTVLILVILIAFGVFLVGNEYRLYIVEALAVLLISAACLGAALFAYRYGTRTFDSAASRKAELSSDNNE